ncbi:MAG: glycosyltransferase [Mycoplasmatales bacterium]
MKKKLYICTDCLFYGGVTRMLFNIYDELIKSGLNREYDIKILVSGDFNVDNLDETIREHVVIKPEINFRNFNITDTKKFLKENKKNTFLFVSYYSSAKLLLVSKIFNIPFNFCNRYSGHIPSVAKILKMDSKFFSGFINRCLNVLLNFVQKYVKYGIFLSERTRDFHVKKYNINLDNTIVIPNFVGNDFINIKKKKNSNNEIHINSRILVSKGINQVIDIASGLKERKINCIIKIHGYESGTTTFAKKLKKKISAYNLSEYIEFPEEKNIKKTLPNACLLLSLSQAEGCPNNILEAISIGVPVVAYDCEVGPREMIVKGKNGYLVELNNKNQMIDTIITALEQKWDHEKIKSDAIEKFSSGVAVTAYVVFLRMILRDNAQKS